MHECYLSQYSLLTQPLWLKRALWLLHQCATEFYSQAWISFWNFPWVALWPQASVLIPLSPHGQLWTLFTLGLPHPNGLRECLARSSNMLLPEKWPKGNYKYDTQIKSILYSGGTWYYCHFLYIGVSSGDQKDSLKNQHQSRVLMEDRKGKFNLTPQLSWEISGLGEGCEWCSMERKHWTIKQQTWQRTYCAPVPRLPSKKTQKEASTSIMRKSESPAEKSLINLSYWDAAPDCGGDTERIRQSQTGWGSNRCAGLAMRRRTGNHTEMW